MGRKTVTIGGDLNVPGTLINVRATPKASANRIERCGDGVRVYVTACPENGKANDAIRKLLAKAIGVPKTRLVLVRGDSSRDKTFRVD